MQEFIFQNLISSARLLDRKWKMFMIQFIPRSVTILGDFRQQTELLKLASAASISGSFRHVVFHKTPLPFLLKLAQLALAQ